MKIRSRVMWLAGCFVVGAGVDSSYAQNPFPSIALSDPLPLVPPVDRTRSQSFAIHGNRLFFQQESSHGVELWSSDGTAAGTSLLRDIAPGPASSNPAPVPISAAAPGQFFTASTFIGAPNDTNDSGRELWITDGTANGTRLVSDIEPGALPGVFGDVVWLNNRTYIIGRGRGLVNRVYRTDGTPAGTEVFFDTGTLPGRLRVQRMISGPGRLWMLLRNDMTSSGQLWASDGTTAGTVLIADLPASAFDTAAGARGLLGVSSNDMAYLGLNDAAHGSEPWVADSSGARLLKDLSPGTSGSAPREFAALDNGRVVISAGPQFSFPGQLFGSDGTEAGTSQIAPVYVVGNTAPFIISSGPLAFFVTFAPQTGYEVWRSDGTAPGTFVLKDIVPGENGTIATLPVGLRTTNGLLYFLAGDGALWRSDGTTNGTTPVPGSPTMTPGTAVNTAAANGVYFISGPDASTRFSLWRTDGTAPGTRLLLEPVVAPTVWTSNEPIAQAGGLAFFVGSDSNLWRTNGTPAGTFGLGFEPGTAAGPRVELVPAAPALYAPGFDQTGFRLKLFRSDGSLPGTQAIADLGDFATNDARNFAWLDGLLFFSHTRDGETRWEPWLSDGTANGTAPLADLNPGPGGSYPRDAFRFGDSIFFAADDGARGVELWQRRADGAVVPFGNFAPDDGGVPGHWHPRGFVSLGSRFLFSAVEGPASRRTLWVSDGTVAGTQPVECAADEPEDLVILNGAVVFSAQDGGSGRELWSSDGTAAGTHLVKDIFPGAGAAQSSNPRHLTVVGTRIFFSADDGVNGVELWVTDGTTAGTTLVKDIYPGRGSSDPQALTAAGTRLAFVALDPARGRELHVSDGTTAGTVMTEDFVPGPLDGAISRTAGRAGGVFWFGRAPADSHHRLRFTALP